jgi:type III restriction enzyme
MPVAQPIGKKTFVPGQLIVNSPYEEPSSFWSYDRKIRMFERRSGRRPAGYIRATPGSAAFDDPGVFVELPLVNKIRPRVKSWREAGYPGATGITKRLLEHWRDPEERRDRRFFFCQLEAIETFIWLAEADPSEKAGIEIPSDGGPFPRLCAKMATGSGKTIVMAMLIAWQVLNKATYPRDGRFSKYVFIVAPGLTVKNRLQVLVPDSPNNYYDEFNIVPGSLAEKMRLGMIRVRNWHVLNWETQERLSKKHGVDKRGALSDEAYTRDVLGEMATGQNILVINDEAHHAWRVPAGNGVGLNRTELEEATKWTGGLDRIHGTRGILACYDFSATPFVPSGKKASEEALFGWIVSDFGLNDAIESGLVKTPRVVVRDNGRLTKEYKSRLYHIYADQEVKDDLNRKAEPHEPLPDLVTNAYYLLGEDWLETARSWKKQGYPVPPVMITVANRTETAARIKYAFDHGKIRIEELAAPEKTLHIDSKVLDMAEAKEESEELDAGAATDDEAGADDDAGGAEKKLTRQQLAEKLRQIVDTVGQVGKPGESIQKVISVGMLSEGWDAKTVTHIMGLRAFTSQLLCEQVVGRGLRRTAYDVNGETGLFDAEYVNIFGVPFTFLPHEGGEDIPPVPPQPKTLIQALPSRRGFAITWPNVLRIDHAFLPRLTLDMEKVPPLELDAAALSTRAEMGPILEGKPDVTHLAEIDLRALGQKFRMQKIVFDAARDVFDQMKPSWKGTKEALLAQVIGLVDLFLRSDRVRIKPELFHQDELRRRIALTLGMNKIVQHIWEAIRQNNTEAIIPVLDAARPLRSTEDVRPWYTGRPCEVTKKSHISHCVFDSTWEASEAFELDHNENVEAWAKNDHLGFEVLYLFGGVVHKYRPDFLIRLKSGTMLVLEVKGEDDQRNQTKRKFLDEWVRAINQHGGFGQWAWAVSRELGDLPDILAPVSHGH